MRDTLNTFDVYIANKVNELAARHGLNPWGWECEINLKSGELEFVSKPPGAQQGGRFEAMMAALGCIDDKVSADDVQMLCETLDNAIQNAPRLWAR